LSLFPTDTKFEKLLFESPPLQGAPLLAAETLHGGSFPMWTGTLMHIAIISHIDMSYCCIHFSGYMSCPNAPIFSALHHAMQYLFHHSHLPIMYPSKEMKKGGDVLVTHWAKGQAEYIYPLNLVMA